jgi:hypothetical protein
LSTVVTATVTTTPTKKNLELKVEKKFVAFNIKQQRRVFLELSCKE